jgi:hypothetical protein
MRTLIDLFAAAWLLALFFVLVLGPFVVLALIVMYVMG